MTTDSTGHPVTGWELTTYEPSQQGNDSAGDEVDPDAAEDYEDVFKDEEQVELGQGWPNAKSPRQTGREDQDDHGQSSANPDVRPAWGQSYFSERDSASDKAPNLIRRRDRQTGEHKAKAARQSEDTGCTEDFNARDTQDTHDNTDNPDGDTAPPRKHRRSKHGRAHPRDASDTKHTERAIKKPTNHVDREFRTSGSSRLGWLDWGWTCFLAPRREIRERLEDMENAPRHATARAPDDTLRTSRLAGTGLRLGSSRFV